MNRQVRASLDTVSVAVRVPPRPSVTVTQTGPPGPRGPTGPIGPPGPAGPAGGGTELLADGQGTYNRRFILTNTTMVSGRIVFTYFTAAYDQTVRSLGAYTGSAAAAATPSLCRLGLYAVDPLTEDLTLLTQTANDTTMFDSSATRFVRPVEVAVDVVAGGRYAFAPICVSAAAMPSLYSSGVAGGSGVTSQVPPRVQAQLSGQADLPATVANSGLAVAGVGYYGEVLAPVLVENMSMHEVTALPAVP